MKSIFELILIIFMLLINTACDKAAQNNTSQNEPNVTSPIGTMQNLESIPKNENSTESESSGNEVEEDNMINIDIIAGDSVFSAKFYDNEAARALSAQFPMTMNMSDLNSNEKYYDLSDKLPSESTEKPAIINTGDIMCWSGDCLVLFYKTFSNSYGGYVRLGYIEDVSSLTAALGSGSVQITFTISD